MAPAPQLVRTARCLWQWQWEQLMNGLGPADAEGHYRRPPGAFSTLPPMPADATSAGAHVMIVGRSCPWAHRAWLVWSLRQLGTAIELVVVEPDPQAGRWCFSEPFEGCSTLAELYRRSGAAQGSRATVPALYSRSQGGIVVSESARLIELLNRWPQGESATGLDLEPTSQAEATAQWRERLQEHVNDGVYRCGFARNQTAYDHAEGALFATLEAANASLQERPGEWLSGPGLSLADVVLFPTLIRLELVYAPLFGCSRLALWQLPGLWHWRARFHGLTGVAQTCWEQAWRQDYFAALFPLNPSGIVPAAPALSTLVHGSPPPA
jgi:putative glutathione S-transferase